MRPGRALPSVASIHSSCNAAPDVLAACKAAALDCHFLVSEQTASSLLLVPVSEAPANAWQRVASLWAGGADAGLRVELGPPDAEANGIPVSVVGLDPRGHGTFCAELRRRLRGLGESLQEPVGLESLEDFLLSAAPDAGPDHRADVAELLRQRTCGQGAREPGPPEAAGRKPRLSVSDWYACDEGEGGGAGTGGAPRRPRKSLGDWYLDDQPQPSAATSFTRAFALSTGEEELAELAGHGSEQ